MIRRNFTYFVWSFENCTDIIRNLLSGEEVELVADVNNCKFNALKFRTIKIVISIDDCNDTQINEDLQKLLGDCIVQLKYSGECNYKWGDDVYRFPLRDELILEASYSGDWLCNKSNENSIVNRC